MQLLFRLLSRLPLSVLHFLGGWLGRLIRLLSPTYRRHLADNLTLAVGEAEASRLVSRCAAEAGKGALEMAYVWLRPKKEVVAKVIKMEGWDLVEAAWERGEGIIFITPHLGCFEITAQYYAAHAPITVLYKPAKQASLEALIEAGRKGEQVHLAPADMGGVKRLLKALRKREAVGLLPDQVPGNGEGSWIPWFGQPAYTMTLAARLTEVPGSFPIFAWAERLPGGAGFHMRMSLPRTPISGSLEERAKAINEELERLIRLCPEQYLWGYNRYKAPRGGERPAS